MNRFALFVHGSNLFTTFKTLDVHVSDYESLYRHIFLQAAARWRSTFDGTDTPPAQLLRAYWYVVDAMDEWDLTNPRSRQHLQERFFDDRDLKAYWMNELGSRTRGVTAELEAFNLCYDDLRNWYDRRQHTLGGMNRFYHAVEAASDFIEIRRTGRWKVDLLRKNVTERGVDVAFAVEMLMHCPFYELAVLVGADTDGVPGIDHIKQMGKQVAVVELLKGSAQDSRGRSFASPLRMVADFIVPIYEADLVRLGIAHKGGDEGYGISGIEPAA